MQCLSCATELLRPANFCPVCGARLAAPVPDGSTATTEGNAPTLVSVDAPPTGDVVYLADRQPDPAPLAPNPHAATYDQTPVAPSDAPREVSDNPFGNFFGDGPSAWLEDDFDDEYGNQPRMVGTLLAAASIALLVCAWVIWGAAMYQGAGGAESGGFVLLSLICWVVYLSLPKQQQHRRMLTAHDRVTRFVERRINPVRSRTEGQLRVRRERGRYRSMRDERTRRVTALGEAAYRGFRHGTLPVDLHPAAQRVLAMEQQMMLQDHRLHELTSPQPKLPPEATDPPEPGHPTE